MLVMLLRPMVDQNLVSSNYEKPVDGAICRHESTLRINSSPPGQNGRHFADDVLRCVFVNETCYILIKISLKYVPSSSIDNTPGLVQVMAWRRTGDKPLPEPVRTPFTDPYMRH